ncbi:MAG: NlpC/P60 family protein [Verrucomicrobiota bacterium]
MRKMFFKIIYLKVLFLTLSPLIIHGQVSTRPLSQLEPVDIVEFEGQPAIIQQLISFALEIGKEGLAFKYGSFDPKNGGMDCSGTVHHILLQLGIKSPRETHTVFEWVDKEGNLNEITGSISLDSSQLHNLGPGDLLFWEGTYDVGDRDPPISHVMIFIGHRKDNLKPVMVGASSSRGVSILEFKMPRPNTTYRFVAYGTPPGLRGE